MSTFVDLPVYSGETPVEVICNFYRDLGWDGQKEIQPSKVVINENDWLKMYTYIVNRKDLEDTLPAGFLLADRGPSGREKIPEGKVFLEEGWIE